MNEISVKNGDIIPTLRQKTGRKKKTIQKRQENEERKQGRKTESMMERNKMGTKIE